MNKLLTQDTGGMPLELEDLDFMQEAYFQGFEAALSLWGNLRNGYLIISGVEVSAPVNNRYSVSGGYILWNNEIRKVLPSIYQGNLPIQLTVQDTYDPSGRETFADGVTRDTYQIRNAKVYEITIDPTPTHVLTIEDNNRLSHLIAQQTQELLDVQQLVIQDVEGVRYDFTNSDFEFNVTADPSNPPYAVKKNGRVALYGAVIHSTATSNAQLINLPSGFSAKKSPSTAPTGNDYYYYLQPCGDDGICIINLRSGTNIDVGVIPVAPTSNGSRYTLDGIVYEVDL